MTNTNREEELVQELRAGRVCPACGGSGFKDSDLQDCPRCDARGLLFSSREIEAADTIENQGREIERYREALTEVHEAVDSLYSEGGDGVFARHLPAALLPFVNPLAVIEITSRAALQSPTQAPLQESEPGGLTVGK